MESPHFGRKTNMCLHVPFLGSVMMIVCVLATVGHPTILLWSSPLHMYISTYNTSGRPLFTGESTNMCLHVPFLGSVMMIVCVLATVGHPTILLWSSPLHMYMYISTYTHTTRLVDLSSPVSHSASRSLLLPRTPCWLFLTTAESNRVIRETEGEREDERRVRK